MGLRYEVWDEPWNTGGFGKRIAKLPVMPGTGTGDVRFLSTGGAGQAEVALAGFDRMNEVVSPTVGSMIRVFDGDSIVAEWLPQRTSKNLVGAAKTAPLSGNNLVSVFDQVINYAREYPNLVSEIQDTIWAGRNILSDPGFEDARVEPEIYEIILDGGTGTFTLTVHGATTVSIVHDAAPLTVELALQGIGTPTINDVLVDETADGFTIEFVDPAVPDADMTWTPSLSGGGGDWELEITQPGRVDTPTSWTKSQYADQSSNPRVHGTYASPPGGFQLVGPTYPTGGPVRTGNSSLRVNGLTRYAGAQQVLNVEPGMTYQASTWVNTSDATEVFKLVIRDVFEKWIAQDESLIDGANTWTNYAIDEDAETATKAQYNTTTNVIDLPTGISVVSGDKLVVRYAANAYADALAPAGDADTLKANYFTALVDGDSTRPEDVGAMRQGQIEIYLVDPDVSTPDSSFSLALRISSATITANMTREALNELGHLK
ncbi:hypothetical protein LCGC14_1759870, partial [marine sediment metagenome]